MKKKINLPYISIQSTLHRIYSAGLEFLNSESNLDFQEFIRHFYHHHIGFLSKKSLLETDFHFLARRCLQAWDLLYANHSLKQPLIELLQCSYHDKEKSFLCLINYDAPFIVDTIVLAIKKMGIDPHDIIHPIIKADFDPDGVIQGLFQAKNNYSSHCAHVSIVSITLPFRLNFEEEEKLIALLKESLYEQHLVISEYLEMTQQATKILSTCLPLSPHDKELKNFIDWLFDGRFTIIGYRSSDNQTTLGLFQLKFYREDSFLKPLKNSSSFQLQKTARRSNVHRHSRIVSIEVHSSSSSLTHQIIGIFNTQFYREYPFQIPLLNKKLMNVLKRFRLRPEWHDAKKIRNLLLILPNDELLFLTSDDLFSICNDLLYSDEGVGLIKRIDAKGHTITLQVFVPREWYSGNFTTQLCHFFENFFKGQLSSSDVTLSDLPFVRILIVIDLFETSHNMNFKCSTMRSQIAQLAMTWEGHLAYIQKEKLSFIRQWEGVFPKTYQTLFSPQQASIDVLLLEKCNNHQTTEFSLIYQDNQFLLKVFQPCDRITLSQVMPILENFGFHVISEQSFKILYDQRVIWIHYFVCQLDEISNHEELNTLVIQMLQRVWQKTYDDDFFNQLCVRCSLNYLQVNVFRAYSKALKQFLLPFSMRYCALVLCLYPTITRLLWTLFEQRHNPDSKPISEQALLNNIFEALKEVLKSDHDKIIRAYLCAFLATTRTNFYQNKEYLSFKFDSAKIKDIVSPIPLYEIFVYSKYMEGCHLRSDKVARGGIRWSDRLEDFRSEVLALMKAQMLKNSIIVPQGSKGGFICKQYEALVRQKVSPQELEAEVIRCYETFIRGLLDVTDNRHETQIIHPPFIKVHDDNDPYLVVAADKGTATFSNIANQIAQEYNFWLDDAFASGGATGYDHKKLAITARGAWVSVCHHFLKKDISPNKDSITVIGIGDMSGDVFGNGMLQSNKIKLIAAFNHQHIFIDPHPDCHASFNERQRLFNQPRSTWKDYDPSLISMGGGVFDRSEKQIVISPQMIHALDIKTDQASFSPDELIMHILKSPVDLLWFGGIGTFVKSSQENHMDAKDRLNDFIRIDANQLRVKVIAEGANLGMTHAARLEYAHQGGILNTDFIDNSGGVDCSDHEVNLKILFSGLIQEKKMNRSERDQLLKEMSHEVCQQVLENNQRQNEILSFMEIDSSNHIDAYDFLLTTFENYPTANFVRRREHLPERSQIIERKYLKKGFLRPELCVTLSYAKNILVRHLAQYPLEKFNYILKSYFPSLLQQRFEQEIELHPLKNELLATLMANGIINDLGAVFPFEIAHKTNKNLEEVVYLYYSIYQEMNMKEQWKNLKQLQCSRGLKEYFQERLIYQYKITQLIYELLNKEDV